MPAKALNAVPVEARQREQWQFAEYRNASVTSYRTAPQAHEPASLVAFAANVYASRRRWAGRECQSRDMKTVGTSQISRNATSSDVDAPCRSNVKPRTTTKTRQKMRYAPVKRTRAAVC